MKKEELIRMATLASLAVGTVLGIVNSILEDQRMDIKINEAVQAKLAEMNK